MTREEAIRRIKAWNLDADDMEVLSEVIPELKESKESEDERRRKWLYDYISNCPNNNFDFYGGVGKDAVLNYLEKQKEQKDYHKLYEGIDKYGWFRKEYIDKCIDKEFEQKEQKPAESISHLTVKGKGVYKICPRCKERMVRDDSKVYTSMPPQYGYECPKCGEIEFDTTMYDNPEMEEKKPAEKSEYERIRKAIVTLIKDLQHYSTNYAGVDPTDMLAWLENHNPSFKQISNSIIWDSGLRTGIELGKKQKEQKPTEWSEKDERIRQSIIKDIEWERNYTSATAAATGKVIEKHNEQINWLKSLSLNLKKKNEDVEKLCSNEWSEEDEKIRKDLIKYLESDRNYQPCQDASFYDSSIAWLEKQKECGEANFREGYLHGFEDAQKEQKPVPINSDDKYMLERTMALIEFCDDKETIWSWLCEKVKVATQKPVEWSEEDRAMIDDIIFSLPRMANGSIEMLPSVAESYSERLKSLRPQPHTVSIKDATKFGNLEYERGVKNGIQYAKNRQWKPSEGQMEALSETIAFAPDTFKPKCTLVTLQDDLKKLQKLFT